MLVIKINTVLLLNIGNLGFAFLHGLGNLSASEVGRVLKCSQVHSVES